MQCSSNIKHVARPMCNFSDDYGGCYVLSFNTVFGQLLTLA